MSSEPRTTVENVRDELDYEVDQEDDLQTYVTDAHLLVEQRIGGYGVAEATLTRIETLVATHRATAAQNGETTGQIEEGFEIADASKDYNVDLLTDSEGRELTSYWEWACALDPTGRLPDPPLAIFETY